SFIRYSTLLPLQRPVERPVLPREPGDLLGRARAPARTFHRRGARVVPMQQRDVERGVSEDADPLGRRLPQVAGVAPVVRVRERVTLPQAPPIAEGGTGDPGPAMVRLLVTPGPALGNLVAEQ